MDSLEIYHRYYQRVRAFVRATVRDDWVAEDLLQETFLRVQEHFHEVRDLDRVQAWVFRIASNVCMDHFRRVKAGTRAVREERDMVPLWHEVPAAKRLEQDQMSRCVQDKIALLPWNHRVVLMLSDIMSFSLKEMADILDISLANAKVRLHRARKKLRTILEEQCAFEKDERNVLVCEPKSDPPPGP